MLAAGAFRLMDRVTCRLAGTCSWPGPFFAPVIEPGLGVGGRIVASLLAPLAVEIMFAVTAIGGDAPSVYPTMNIDPKRVLLLMPKWAGPFLLLELQQVLKRSNQFIMVEPAAWQIFSKRS